MRREAGRHGAIVLLWHFIGILALEFVTSIIRPPTLAYQQVSGEENRFTESNRSLMHEFCELKDHVTCK